MTIFGIITLFPECFNCLNVSIPGRMLDRQAVVLKFFNPRDFTTHKQRRVDDRPYGGGAGMVMQVEPLRDALLAAKKTLADSPVILVSPQGKRFTQAVAAQWCQKPKNLIFVAGRYEGIDERFISRYVDEEWSIGDYILSGGELAIAVICDVLIRLLPNGVGNAASVVAESFSDYRLDYPHYTRPDAIEGDCVPSVLLQGHHANIARWQLKQSIARTWLRRPDLLHQKPLSQEEKILLEEFIEESTHVK